MVCAEALTQIGVHAFGINVYLHEFFEPISFDSIFLTPMDYRQCEHENFICIYHL